MARVCPHSEWFACLWLFIVCIRAWRREAFSRDKPVTARPLHREHHGHFVVACLHPSLTLKPRLQVSAATRGFARPVTVERLPPARIDSTGVGETTVFEHSLSLSLSLVLPRFSSADRENRNRSSFLRSPIDSSGNSSSCPCSSLVERNFFFFWYISFYNLDFSLV